VIHVIHKTIGRQGKANEMVIRPADRGELI